MNIVVEIHNVELEILLKVGADKLLDNSISIYEAVQHINH